MTAKRDKLEPFSPKFLHDVVINGDCLDVLSQVPDRSFHFIALFPPYFNAMPYSHYETYDDYLGFMEKVGLEAHRTLKEGRFMAINTSPVIVERTKRSTRSRRYTIPFDLNSIFLKQGWEFMEDIVWVKPEGAAKWRNANYREDPRPLCWRPNLVTEHVMVYRGKTDKSLEWNVSAYPRSMAIRNENPYKMESTNVWSICPASDPVHPAVAPIGLVDRLIWHYTFKGDLILDPFGGSGTTAVAARSAGRLFTLIERSEEYVGRIKERLLNEKGVTYLSALDKN